MRRGARTTRWLDTNVPYLGMSDPSANWVVARAARVCANRVLLCARSDPAATGFLVRVDGDWCVSPERLQTAVTSAAVRIAKTVDGRFVDLVGIGSPSVRDFCVDYVRDLVEDRVPWELPARGMVEHSARMTRRLPS